MGAIVLAVALVVEAAFAAYCIVTRSSQERVRSLLRVGALVAFVTLALVSVIEWSFRWYLLAALLLVWAALGARTLIRGTSKTTMRSPWRVVLSAVTTLAIIAVAVAPALVFPQYKSPKVTGNHQVATASYTYVDPSRVEAFASTGENRKVNVGFWYPKDDNGKHPLVVFSHGAFGMKASNTSTFVELASHGYVVCSIDHPYHALLTIGSDRTLVRVDGSYLQEVQDANRDVYDDEADIKLYQKWMALRAADIGFVLDTITANSRKGDGSDGVYRLVDTDKIGLIGHSMGGAASALAARQRSDVDAIVNLDADLLGEYLGYTNGKPVVNDAIYPIPLLSIYTDDMTQLFAAVKDPSDVAAKRVAATAPIAYEIHIAGTSHMSLTDLPLISPLAVSLIGNPKGLVHENEADPLYVVETMNAKALEFFNSYLKGEGRFTSAGAY